MEFVCKLTTDELKKRKATVIARLKNQVKEKAALPNGYAYLFSGDDDTIDELIDFIKTERICCDFFHFNLAIAGDKSDVWLEISGPEGVKDFINTELSL